MYLYSWAVRLNSGLPKHKYQFQNFIMFLIKERFILSRLQLRTSKLEQYTRTMH